MAPEGVSGNGEAGESPALSRNCIQALAWESGRPPVLAQTTLASWGVCPAVDQANLFATAKRFFCSTATHEWRKKQCKGNKWDSKADHVTLLLL